MAGIFRPIGREKENFLLLNSSEWDLHSELFSLSADCNNRAYLSAAMSSHKFPIDLRHFFQRLFGIVLF